MAAFAAAVKIDSFAYMPVQDLSLIHIYALGLYGYSYLDNYWTEENRWAFFLKADGKLAGFAMVNDYPESGEKTDFCMSEFFVMYPYRKHGLGKEAAFALFDRFPGTWQLKYHPKNIPSVHFWNRVVDAYKRQLLCCLQKYIFPAPQEFAL